MQLLLAVRRLTHNLIVFCSVHSDKQSRLGVSSHALFAQNLTKFKCMSQWERPYMEKCADELEITSLHDVLEVGFGCGYSAERIQVRRADSRS